MTIDERVKNVIADKFNVLSGKIKSTSSLTDLGADSLDPVEIIMDLEKEFRIEISDEDAARLQTVQDIVNYIEERTK